MKKKVHSRFVRGLSMMMASLMLCLILVNTAPPAFAAKTSVEALQQQLEQYEEKLKQDKAALQAMKQNTADAKKRKENLEGQIGTLKSQIGVLLESIATVQNDLSNTQKAIEDKEGEIALKEDDIHNRRENFKRRMAAMQEMHDAGAMAMLANVSNLYQLLTFSEVLQDIANKDTEILEQFRTEKADLEAIKADLEAKKAEMEQLNAELTKQKSAMNKKRDELGVALKDAGKDLEEAAAAQKEIQDQVDSDELNYEALQKQIEAQINSAEGAHGDLSFNGAFGCPLRSGSFRISSLFGPRSLNGKKYHYGVDYAAAAGTPIYAAADGYVTYAGWNSGGYGNYVLIYHGKMSDGNTYSTLYAHMLETPCVTAGQYVTRGTQIGKVGNTGRSQGNHLHLELWQGSNMNNSVANKAKRINPAQFIPMK